MARRLILLTFFILTLVACQPEVVYLEVTTTPGAAAAPATTRAAASPAAGTAAPTTAPRTVTRTVTITQTVPVTATVTAAPVGDAARPIQLLFPPHFDSALINERGAALADALAAATGAHFEVGLVDDEAALVELMCAAPAETVGILSPAGYVLGHEECNLQPINVARGQDGLTWEAGMLVTRRGLEWQELADLEGGRWAVPDRESIPNALYFEALLQDAGVSVGEIVEVAGDNEAMLAVFNGEVDFATAAYLPPITPADQDPWQYGEDPPEVWRRLGIPPTRSPIGYVLVLAEPEFGGYRLRDARAGIFDIEPEIYNETGILTLSAPIPHETVVVGAAFPVALARRITAVLNNLAASEACDASLCAGDFYDWQGLEAAEDADYEPLRFIRETLELTEAEFWALTE